MPLIDEPMDESTPALVAALQARWPATSSGHLLDTEAGDAPVWCGSASSFERWFVELEACLDLTLGRRLAHAAAESEENRWAFAPPLPQAWFGAQKKRIAAVNADWAVRGLGQIGLLESNAEGETILVANRTHTSIAAGMGNAAWECIQDRRYRFQWSDRGAGETVVELTPDPRNIPVPKACETGWTDVAGAPLETERYFDRARREATGVWTVEGNRCAILQRDLFLRFESLVTPHLLDSSRSTDCRTEWDGIDDAQRVMLWDGMAEASRRQFLGTGDLVLIAEPDHWIGATRQHLARQGLGMVTEAETIDDHGGIRLRMPAAFHPAIAVGRLLGCWERAEGRSARATWASDVDGHLITLQSRRTIAD
jgi:hypothetical protein